MGSHMQSQVNLLQLVLKHFLTSCPTPGQRTLSESYNVLLLVLSRSILPAGRLGSSDGSSPLETTLSSEGRSVG